MQDYKTRIVSIGLLIIILVSIYIIREKSIVFHGRECNLKRYAFVSRIVTIY